MAPLRYAGPAFLISLSLAGSARASTQVTFQPFESGVSILGDLSAPVDDLTIAQTSTAYVITRAAGGSLISTDDGCVADSPSQVTCPRADSVSLDLGDGDDRLTTVSMTTPLLVAGGAGDDTLGGGSGNDILVGGPGNDVLVGGAGPDFLVGSDGRDDFFGNAGHDSIDAQDGVPERIDCGAGRDESSSDAADVLIACEPSADADADGFSPAVDCSDGDARIFPGAPEIFDNGVDENCDGRDAVNLDRDADGFSIPGDCNDADATIRPNALEIRGNRTDENCDQRADAFAEATALVAAQFKLERGYTRLRSLVVRLAATGTRILLRCDGRGCPRPRTRARIVPRDLAPIALHRRFAKARLRPGVRLTLAITAPETIGRTSTYTIRRSRPPNIRTICRAPGERRSHPC